jgi:hypothetical protein
MVVRSSLGAFALAAALSLAAGSAWAFDDAQYPNLASGSAPARRPE